MDRYQFEDCLSDYLENNLSPSKRKEFEEYLKAHSNGKELVDSVRELMDSMKSMSGIKVPPDFMGKLQQRIEAEKNNLSLQSPEKRTYLGFAPFHLGMMVVVLVGLIFVGMELLPTNGIKIPTAQQNIDLSFTQDLPVPVPPNIKKDEMVTLEQDSSAIKDQDTKAPFDLDKRGATFVKDQK